MFQGWVGRGWSLACYLHGWGIPSPLPTCSPALVHRAWLCPHPRSFSPRAIARPP